MKVGIYDGNGELFKGLGILLMDLDFEPVLLESPKARTGPSDCDIYIFRYESGIEPHLAQLRDSRPDVPIVVSGLTDLKTAIEVSHTGVSDIFGEKIDLMHLSRLLAAARKAADARENNQKPLEEMTRQDAVAPPEPEIVDSDSKAVVDAFSINAEFSECLLMVGDSETPFEPALREHFDKTSTLAVEFFSCPALEPGQLGRIAERLDKDSPDILVFLDLDSLPLSLQQELESFIKTEGLAGAARMIFCCREDPLTLVEENRLTENIYLKIARRETEVANFLKSPDELEQAALT